MKNFPMSEIFLPWPDFAHGQAVFPWEKPVSHRKRFFLPWESEFQVLFIVIYNKDRESILSFYELTY